MKNFRLYHLIIFIASLLFVSCGKETSFNENRIVIGIDSDIETINPLYAFKITEGNITELLFPGLFKHEWNDEKGNLETSSMLASAWAWNENKTKLTIKIRDDIFWTDGEQLTTDDIWYSFLLYSEPKVQSKFFGTFDNFFLTEDGKIIIEKSFNVINRYEIEFNFVPGSTPDLFDVDMSILPKHVFEKIPFDEIGTSEINFNPVSSGPYKLERWIPKQSLTLILNETSFLASPKSIKALVFKVIPEYQSRLTQLRNRQIDILQDVKPNDIALLESLDFIKIGKIKGRDFDYVGWNNIDPESFEKDNIVKPHHLFGNKNIRKALTLGINRGEILDEFLLGFGEVAGSPISSIFKESVDTNLSPLPYNPDEAKRLLYNEGWNNYGADGILRKENERFSFKLSFPSGNPLRNYIATVIMNDLKKIGIEAIPEPVEPGIFFERMFSRELDAWIAGFIMPIPLDLKQFWHSDLHTTMMNVAGFQNKDVDLLLDSLQKDITIENKNSIYKKLQNIFYEEQPVTFLFWIDNLVAYNKNIKNIEANPYGIILHCWKWYKEE